MLNFRKLSKDDESIICPLTNFTIGTAQNIHLSPEHLNIKSIYKNSIVTNLKRVKPLHLSDKNFRNFLCADFRLLVCLNTKKYNYRTVFKFKLDKFKV